MILLFHSPSTTAMPHLCYKATETMYTRSGETKRTVLREFYPGSDNLCSDFEMDRTSIDALLQQDVIQGKYIMSFAGHRPVWAYVRATPDQLEIVD